MAHCPQCRFDNPESAAYCASCGAALSARYGRAAGTRQGLAIASLTLALASLPLLMCFLLGLLTAPVAIVLGIVALTRATRNPGEYGGRGLAIGGIVAGGLCLLFAIPFVAAIAIPSLLRARVSANEAAAIGDIRSLISAEVAYAAANRSFYDTPECLAAPRQCIPAYAESGPTFADAQLASRLPRNGYVRRFHGGDAPASAERRGASPTSVRRFAYEAVPERYGVTGTRAFCGDETGRVCQVGDGRIPVVADDRCSASCVTLR